MDRRTLLLALGLGACAVPLAPAPATDPIVTEIAVIDRGWHTDIALPVDGPPLHPLLAGLAAGYPGVRVLLFGFGDRAWLLGADNSPIGMLAALLPAPGAILMTALAVSPEAAFGAEQSVPLGLSLAEFCRLQHFLADSLDRSRLLPDGRLGPLAEGPYPGSVFHASPIHYSASRTCNTWTAEALAAAGLPITAGGVLFAHQVMARARRAAALRASLSGPARSRHSAAAGSGCCC
ncbi:DUF2459 domain-containing protein [Belnapia rosea]|uniref:DUF2459 domain-containing protein n=1 Tax=Belnapia rosea TaxID=938405 RepID=UPI00159FA4AB|nr:DUF2459 domain-containing protein [Belnapia rosea]